MKLEELINEIKIRLEIAKSDISKLRATIPQLFKAAESLAFLNKEEALKLKTSLLELNSLTDNQIINLKIDEIITELANIKAQKDTDTQDTYLVKYYGIKSVERTNNYLKTVDNYKSSLKAIKKCESDILSAKEYVKNLHEPMVSGKYEKYLPAKVNNNLRLMYYIDKNTKILFFEDIITKNDLEKT